ncbi:MAG: SMP-30/gluconolactonase/LRE family protein [Saprospiraceae bacterium]
MSDNTNTSPRTILSHTSQLGEGPVWDSKRQTIIWVDILNGIIHEYSPTQKQYRTIATPSMVGAVALKPDGNLIAALQNGLAFVDRTSGAISMLHDPESHLPGNRFNDGKCDPGGRFWVGSMSLAEEQGAGNLYMIDNNLTTVLKIPGVSISNGLAWSPDHSTFYYIDTPTREVWAFDYDLQTGNIANKRVVIRIPETEGSPDGMTIDREGMLWIAHWDGWQISRWDPGHGEQLLSIRLPVARVTSCTFGGPDLQHLYITSARVGLTTGQLAQQPLAGSLFVIENFGYQGLPAHEFDHQQKEQ